MYGGATLQPGDPSRSVLNLLSSGLSIKPDIVYFHFGENDLDVLTPDQISGAISAVTVYISSVCPSVKSFIVSELFPFPKFLEQFHCDPRSVVGPVNTSLSASIQSLAPLPGSMTAKLWHHEMGLWKGNSNLFRSDRTHLNDLGLHCYWLSVRAAITTALHAL
jgi:hypothetical protein